MLLRPGMGQLLVHACLSLRFWQPLFLRHKPTFAKNRPVASFPCHPTLHPPRTHTLSPPAGHGVEV